MLKRQSIQSDRVGHRLWYRRIGVLSATLMLGHSLCLSTMPVLASSDTSSVVFKAIDPSTAQMDELPPSADTTKPAQSNSTQSNPFNAPIQGQPLKGARPQAQPNGAVQPNSASGGGAPSGNQASGSDSGFGMETAQIDATPDQELRITNLEQKAFGSTYSEHDVSDRLDHLEKETFGSSKKGDLNTRIVALETKLLGGSAFGGGGQSQLAMQSRPQANSQYPSSNNPASTAPPAQPIGQSSWIVPGQSGSAPASQPGNYAAALQQRPAQQPQSPVQNQQRPTQYQAPQGQYQQPPAQYQQPPAQYQQPPAQYQQPPAQYQQPPAQYQQPPAQYQQPPAQYQQPPAQYQQPPAQYQQPPAQYQQPPAQYQQPGRVPAPPGQYVAPPPVTGGFALDASVVANGLAYDTASGDYLAAIKKFPSAQGGQTVAHWLTFPVKVKVPAGSPESWQRSLEAVIARWGQYVPVKMALPKEEPNAEIIWVNTLPKGILGVTRFSVKSGRLHCWVYLLRPSFYPPEISEQSLSNVFLKEMGHVLGLLGKSDKLGDLMYQADSPAPATKTGSRPGFKSVNISSRDINTLKRVYESPALPDGFSLNEPLEWATTY